MGGAVEPNGLHLLAVAFHLLLRARAATIECQASGGLYRTRLCVSVHVPVELREPAVHSRGHAIGDGFIDATHLQTRANHLGGVVCGAVHLCIADFEKIFLPPGRGVPVERASPRLGAHFAGARSLDRNASERGVLAMAAVSASFKPGSTHCPCCCFASWHGGGFSFSRGGSTALESRRNARNPGRARDRSTAPVAGCGSDTADHEF